jgi:hypothetical protein
MRRRYKERRAFDPPRVDTVRYEGFKRDKKEMVADSLFNQ